jgi:hypothetical protein
MVGYGLRSAILIPAILLASALAAGFAALSAHAGPANAAQRRIAHGLPTAACFGSAVKPPYADPPRIQIWSPLNPNRSAGGPIPVCGGIGQGPFKELVALAGRFRYGGDAAGLLARFGAISGFSGLRFWAVAAQRWEELIGDAHALDAPASDRPRADFRPEEMVPGRDLFFTQEDSGAGAVDYHMHVAEVSADHLVLTVENTSRVSMFLFPLFERGDLRFLYRLERLAPGEWGFYSVLQLGPGTAAMAENREASYVNRMTAVYRHIAGIPDTQEPPAAP